MPGYFYCQCCGKRVRKNPRLKIQQKYCGSKICQRARKNAWEHDRINRDPLYKLRRNSQKAQWRKDRPGHQYQKEYRKNQAEYAETNRFQQRIRNKNAPKTAFENNQPKIVKTDTLPSGSLIQCGLYEILPVGTRQGKKIVKTDALIVEIRAHSGF